MATFKRPTIAELAALIEDEYGNPSPLPMAGQNAGQDFGQNAGPDFDQGAGPDQDAGGTQMSKCAATGCANNRDGGCVLEAIDINEHGGCAQYEAIAEGDEESETRYLEEPTDEAGGFDVQADQLPASGQDRHWQTGKRDSKGGGY